MTAMQVVIAVVELIPCPESPFAFAVSFGLSFWYGYRHPEEY